MLFVRIRRAKAVAAIVSQVLTHFGAGYGAPNGNLQIFSSPSDLEKFSSLLFGNTLKKLGTQWDTQSYRDNVCETAYLHGQAAKAATPAGGKLTWAIIETTLKQIKAQRCPDPQAGGGIICAIE